MAPAALCLAAGLACPPSGNAQSCTPSSTCTPDPTATATATPSPAPPTETATPGGIPVPARWLFLSANVVLVSARPVEVRMRLPEPDQVVLKVMNAAGEEMVVERLGPARTFVWVWDATYGRDRARAPPGVYLLAARTDRGAVELQRVVVLR